MNASAMAFAFASYVVFGLIGIFGSRRAVFASIVLLTAVAIMVLVVVGGFSQRYHALPITSVHMGHE